MSWKRDYLVMRLGPAIQRIASQDSWTATSVKVHIGDHAAGQIIDLVLSEWEKLHVPHKKDNPA